MNPLTIHLLGTGGGRIVMTTQRRRTAGIRIHHQDTNIHIDPGPGALVHSHTSNQNPQNLDAIIVTHCHPDHYTDTEVLTEAMTHGTRNRKGTLAATPSVLQGNSQYNQAVSNYHQKLAATTTTLQPGTKIQVNQLTITATHAYHSDPDTVGIIIETPDNHRIAYTSDTQYHPDLSQQYTDLDLLILCVMRPRNRPLRHHLDTTTAAKIIQETRPRRAVLTHFGMLMLNANPDTEAQHIQQKTATPTTAARDNTKITVKPHENN